MTHRQETTASSCSISAGVTFCLIIIGTFEYHRTAIGYPPLGRRGISLSQMASTHESQQIQARYTAQRYLKRSSRAKSNAPTEIATDRVAAAVP